MPAYNDTPLAAQRKNDSQPLIQTNFTTLKTYLEQDHSIITDSGKHKQVTLPVLGAVPATVNGEVAIYTKTVGSNTELFFVRDNTPLVEIPFTGINAGNATLGYSLLPGGIKMLWGRATTPAGGPNIGLLTVATDPAIMAGWPGFTQNPSVQVTLSFAGGAPFIRNAFLYSTNLANFSVQTTNTNTGIALSATFNYLAIGI
jgi:hypothetical protein